MLPIIANFGWDPLWFGIVMTVNLAIGQVTPPVAVNLYVAAHISNLTMEEISRSSLPLIFAAILALVPAQSAGTLIRSLRSISESLSLPDFKSGRLYCSETENFSPETFWFRRTHYPERTVLPRNPLTPS